MKIKRIFFSFLLFAGFTTLFAQVGTNDPARAIGDRDRQAALHSNANRDHAGFEMLEMPIQLDLDRRVTRKPGRRSVDCGMDTVAFAFSRATDLRALNINNATSALGLCQYFDGPDTILLKGLQFYAWSTTLQTINVTVEVYLAGPDSLPSGAPLANVVVPVDTSFGMGDLDTLRKIAMFSSPVEITQAYLLVITNNSPNSIAVVSNDYTASPPDGLESWLASVNLFGTWTRSYDVNVGGIPFDADWLLEPIIGYSLDVRFSSSPNPSGVEETVQFTNMSSGLIGHPMYDTYAREPWLWDFDDENTSNEENPTHAFEDCRVHRVSLTGSLRQWNGNICSETRIEDQEVGSGGGYCCASGSDNTVYIDQVQELYTGYINISGNNFGYGDFRFPAITLNPYFPYTYMALSPGGPFGIKHWLVYVDWDKDNTFSSSEKEIDYCTSIPVLRGFAPPSSFSGSTTMRIVMRSATTGCSRLAIPAGLCGDMGNAEVEDYTIELPMAFGMQPGAGEQEQTYQVFPNPFGDRFTIIPPTAAGGSRAFELEVIDMNGRIVKEQMVPGTDVPSTIDASSMEPGTYFVRIRTDKEVFVKSVVKQGY